MNTASDDRSADDDRPARDERKRLREMLKIAGDAFEFFDQRASGAGYTTPAGSYRYIAYDLSMFLSMMLDLREILRDDPQFADEDPSQPHRPIRFLEIGCGIGRNLFLLKHARDLRFQTLHGIDVVPEYLEEARRLFQLEEHVFAADAMEFDVSSYDAVYFYRPFEDESRQQAFERQLIHRLRPGAYVLSGLAFEIELPEEFQPTPQWRIWRKGS